MPENKKRLSRLDPRAPLVIDTRELPRRPGSMRKVSFAAPAPTDLGAGMIGVPAGAQLDFQLRLESVMEGVLVSGTVTGPLAGECARCLDPVNSDIEVDLQELYTYDEPDASEEDETSHLDGDLLDLEPVLRDAIVLDLELSPLCRDDCPGLCATCGAKRDAGCGHDDTPVDPRWTALMELAEGQPEQE